ncbi:uncharacterized protein LOC134675657 [Cydia fagiglandana]|uniref:uncharacterized protein LOC134675657 n=1 Tax=Cydia fagiglandana TaxID=1458189 RepID=UPI002FEE62E2
MLSLQDVPSIDLDDVELRCKDCAARIGGYSFWCVQCACGALCDACAGRAPHDTHYVLRAPEGATQNQTQTVLAVIRQQLLKGNLLTLYEIDEDGVKKEVKEETEEPAATTDPLAVGPHFEPLTVEPYPDPLTVEPYSEPLTVEPYPDPLTVEHYSEPQIEEPHPDIPDPLTMETDPVTVEPHPDPLTGEPYPEPLTMEPYRDPLTVNPAKATVTECVDDDTNGGHHPNKRPRLMDDTRMGDIPNSSVSEKDGDVSQQILSHVPHIRRGSQIVQTLAPSDLRSQDVIQTTACNIKGSQDAIANISNLRTQQSVLIVPSNVLRRSQTVQPLATGDLGSQDVIQATTCNVKGSLNALATNSNLRTQQSLLNVPSNVLTL